MSYNIINIIKISIKYKKKYIYLYSSKKTTIMLNFLIKFNILKNYNIKNNQIKIELNFLKNKPIIKNFKKINKYNLKNSNFYLLTNHGIINKQYMLKNKKKYQIFNIIQI